MNCSIWGCARDNDAIRVRDSNLCLEYRNPDLASVLNPVNLSLIVIRKIDLTVVIFAKRADKETSWKRRNLIILPICAGMFQNPNVAGFEVAENVNAIHSRSARSAVNIASHNRAATVCVN